MSEQNGALEQNGTLAKIDAARRALVEARSVEEVLDLRDKVAAVAHYLKQCRAGLATQNAAAELKIWCERKIGEMLGDPPGRGRPRGRKMGNDAHFSQIGRRDANRLRKIASIPAGELIAYVHTINEEGKELTTAGVLKLYAALNREPKAGERVDEVISPPSPPSTTPSPPDEPAEILRTLTGLTRKLTVFINTHGDGQKFKKYLLDCGLAAWLDTRDITVRLDDGRLKTFPVRFRGFTALRWFLRLAGKKGTKSPDRVRAEFKDANGADDWQGDADG